MTGWVYVDVVGSDIGRYVESAKAAVAANLTDDLHPRDLAGGYACGLVTCDRRGYRSPRS